MQRNTTKKTALPLAAFALMSLSPVSSASAQNANEDVENATCSANVIEGLADYVWNYFFPVNTNHAGVTPIKRSRVFVPANQRGGLTQKRIVLFGDLQGMDTDTPPLVGDEMRAVFARADLILGNIEAPITYNNGQLNPQSSHFFNFHANVAYLKSWMTQACMNPSKVVFTVANNHADDWGRFEDTVDSYPELGIRGVVGIDWNKDPAATEIQVHDLGGGLRVGLVGWTHLQNNPPPRDANGEIVYPTWEASRRVTTKTDWAARKEALGLDMLIGMPHWDCQGNRFPQVATKNTATLLNNLGFDLIAGHHGMLMPAEVFPGPKNNLVFYSLHGITPALAGSNFLAPLVELVVDQNGRILESTLHPFVNHKVQPSLTYLRAISSCGGHLGFDLPRQTEWKIVPLQSLATGSLADQLDYIKFNNHLDMVFPK